MVSVGWLLLMLAAIAVLLKLQNEKNKKHKNPPALRKWWVRPWLARRVQFGHYEQLMQKLADDDPLAFKNFQKINEELFMELLVRVGYHIEKQQKFVRGPLDADLKLAITLRYLATGNSYKSMEYAFRVGNNTISKFIPEVCEAPQLLMNG